MCNFQAPWFGASYPDGGCEDGFLHDLDGDGYDPDDTSHPCPRCNTRQYLEDERASSQGTESLSWGAGGAMVTISGDGIWEIAKRWARQENSAEADTIILELETPEPATSI